MRVGRFAAVLFAMGASCLACAGCASHTQINAHAEGYAAEQDDRRWEEPEVVVPRAPAAEPGRRPASMSDAATDAAISAPDPAEPSSGALAVVRDLSLAPSASRAAVCRCLAVAYGASDDARFAWQGMPRGGAGAALAIAIAGEGVPCDARGARSLRASIAGVAREGDNIVLTVENVREGTPIVRGAVVPRPPAGARLVVKGRGGAPYGRALTEAGPCQLPLR